MQPIKLLTIAGLLLVINSCKRDCYRDIAYEEKVRLGYKGNETIIFKSSTGKKDTMLMGAINKNVFPGEGKCKDDRESYAISGNFTHKLYTGAGSITLTTQISMPEKESNAYLYPVITTNFGKFALNQTANRITTTINGITVNDVYEMTNSEPIADPNVTKIYFTYNYGFVKILFADGKYWERINF